MHKSAPTLRRQTARHLLGTLFLVSSPLVHAAGLDDASAVPHLDARGEAGYRQFLAAPPHRAFAIAPGGAWAWSQGAATLGDAQEQALESCQAHTQQRCVPYAADRKVVFEHKGWDRLWRPYATAAEAARAPLGTARGQRFPDLSLVGPDGRQTTLSRLRGKVVLLHFWGTWCPSCRHELPQFERLQKALAGKRDYAFVFTQMREPVDTARQWLKQQGIRLDLYDSGARGSRDDSVRLADGQSVRDRAIAPVFPTTYVLDRHGVVVFSLRGSAEDWREYAPFLRDLARGSR
ncbi:MAG: TlpA disulfide reductase family protein [Pseudomonadota bacterium]